MSAGAEHLAWYRVGAADWPSLFEIKVYHEQQRFVPSPLDLFRMRSFCQRSSDALFQVYGIRAGACPIGVFTLSMDPDGETWLGGFQLDWHYQGQGIGTRVLRELIECLQVSTPAVRRLCLNVRRANEQAVTLYQRAGFKIIEATQHGGEPAWVMSRRAASAMETVQAALPVAVASASPEKQQNCGEQRNE